MKNPQNELIKEFAELCRNVGWKFTPARFAVWRYLRGNKEHPVVDRVWENVKLELPKISRESVFRILSDFAERGLIAIMDRPNVLARFDANPKRHDHFYCSKCGRVYDFEIENLETLLPEAAVKIGSVEHVETRIRGVCRECLQATEKQEVA